MFIVHTNLHRFQSYQEFSDEYKDLILNAPDLKQANLDLFSDEEKENLLIYANLTFIAFLFVSSKNVMNLN